MIKLSIIKQGETDFNFEEFEKIVNSYLKDKNIDIISTDYSFSENKAICFIEYREKFLGIF